MGAFSEVVSLILEKPLKKKRGLPKDGDWGDRLLYWMMPPGNEAMISRELGVASLSSFFRGSGTPSKIEERAMQAFGVVTADPPDRWIDARSGLVTIRALLDFARTHPERVKGPDHWGAHAAENFISDLESLEQLLTVADQEGVRFGLQA